MDITKLPEWDNCADLIEKIEEDKKERPPLK